MIIERWAFEMGEPPAVSYRLWPWLLRIVVFSQVDALLRIRREVNAKKYPHGTCCRLERV
jgi:hypothetical protein